MYDNTWSKFYTEDQDKIQRYEEALAEIAGMAQGSPVDVAIAIARKAILVDHEGKDGIL